MLGERLKALRRRQVLSQRELAERAGVALKTIQLAESGQANPHPKTIRKLAAALGVEPYELLGEAKAAA